MLKKKAFAICILMNVIICLFQMAPGLYGATRGNTFCLSLFALKRCVVLVDCKETYKVVGGCLSIPIKIISNLRYHISRYGRAINYSSCCFSPQRNKKKSFVCVPFAVLKDLMSFFMVLIGLFLFVFSH